MRISIAQRLQPFSHTPGVLSLLPGSTIGLQIFPTLIRAYDRSNAKKTLIQEISLLPLSGPVRDFTVQLDLEKGHLIVWGHFAEGFVRYRLFSINRENAFAIKIEKCPPSGISLSYADRPIRAKETFIIDGKKGCLQFQEMPLHVPPETDRLSLGSHRKQDWDFVQQRADLREILPVWLRLGQLIPQSQSMSEEGTGALLLQCQSMLASGEKQLLARTFLTAFQGAFEGIFSPRWMDTQYQGFGVTPPQKDFNTSPLALLSVGAQLIRSLFIAIEEGNLHILPLLPPEFHCGRFLHINCHEIGDLDLEWSKKTIRRLVLHSTQVDRQLNLSFQKGLKRFRLRTSVTDRGKLMEVGTPIRLESGKKYFFDNFEK